MKILKEQYFLVSTLALIFIFFLLYVLAIGPYWKITPDSTTYVMAGNSLANGTGYREGANPAHIFPPMTSMIFSLFLLNFPERFTSLNMLVTVFAFLSLILYFALFRKDLGDLKSCLIILLSFASCYLFRQSTFLLSDIFYIFFSAFALLLVDNLKRESHCLYYWGIGIVVLFACMTRSIGIVLAFSIVIYGLVSLLRKKNHVRSVLLLVMLLPLLFTLIWAMRNSLLGLSYFGLYLQKEIYVPESGYISFVDLAIRFITNLKICRVGSLLTNEMTHHFLLDNIYIRFCAFFLFLLGLLTHLIRKFNLVSLYTMTYFLTVETFHVDGDIRKFVPVIPLLFFFAFDGFAFCVKTAKRLTGKYGGKIVYTAGLLYMLTYIGTGMMTMFKIVPGEHHSPFGEFPIKYEANYDMQRLALWLRDHSSKDMTYICQHPNIWDIVTERKGYIFPFSYDKGKLFDMVEKRGVSYVLADKNKESVRKFLFPILKAYSDLFELITDTKGASLYKVKRQFFTNG